jgi:hypothetical protein
MVEAGVRRADYIVLIIRSAPKKIRDFEESEPGFFTLPGPTGFLTTEITVRSL